MNFSSFLEGMIIDVFGSSKLVTTFLISKEPNCEIPLYRIPLERLNVFLKFHRYSLSGRLVYSENDFYRLLAFFSVDERFPIIDNRSREILQGRYMA